MSSRHNLYPEYLIIRKVTPAYWRATFTNGPLDLFGPETYIALKQLVNDLENSKEGRVVVFDSSSPDFFIAHYDMARAMEEPEGPGTGVISTWGEFALRIVNLPIVTIAAIRGRVRGHGSEFTTACDIRFASRERAIFGQPEVGAGVNPGGGAFEWLPRNVGRSRALEILLGSDDFDASTAELYGWINRAIPDADFEGFVDHFAHRVAGFDARPLVEAKRVVNARSGLPTDVDLFSSMRLCIQIAQTPERAARSKILRSEGCAQEGEVELNMSKILAEVTLSDLS